MAGLVPFHKRSSLRRSIDDYYNMLDEFFNNFLPDEIPGPFFKSTFKLDVQDNDADYIVEADLPGVSKDEININLNDGHLRIDVKKDEKIKEEGKNYIRKERRSMSMSRSIYLPDADNKGVKAKLDNGVLRINIPKAPRNENSFRIEIE